MTKLIAYKGLFGHTPRPATSDRNLLGVSWSLAKYVTNLELDETDLKNLREVAKIGEYVVGDTAEGERIQDRRTCNLESDSWEDRALEWAYLVAAHGETALRQLIVSYNDASITIDIARKHQEVFLRVLRAQNYPVIFSTHGDTDNPHWHAAICVHDIKNDQRGNWGQQFEIEAAHMALAICVFEDQLECEPNRRYVADQTGVYHTWSGIKVASADGTIESTGRIKVVQSRQIAFEIKSVAPDWAETQTMNMYDALRLTASGVVNEAKSWNELHCGLARCGMRYETYTAAGKIAGGYIVATNPDDREDDRIKGSVCNAGYKRLVKKFGDKPFAAPDDSLQMRSFIRPTYFKKSLEDQFDERKERERAAKEAELNEQLSKTLAEKYQLQRDMQLNESTSFAETGSEKTKRIRDASKRLKQEHEQEKLAAAGVKAAIKRDRQKAGRGRPSTAEPVEAIIWGAPPAVDAAEVNGSHPTRNAWQKKYTIRGQAFPRDYHVGGTLAFTETPNLIVLKNCDRQAQIDAILLGQQKFGVIKVHGTRKQRRILICLAAELGVPLDRSQAADGARHLARADQTGKWLSINPLINLDTTTAKQSAPFEPDEGRIIEVISKTNAHASAPNKRTVKAGAPPPRKTSASDRVEGKPGPSSAEDTLAIAEHDRLDKLRKAEAQKIDEVRALREQIEAEFAAKYDWTVREFFKPGPDGRLISRHDMIKDPGPDFKPDPVEIRIQILLQNVELDDLALKADGKIYPHEGTELASTGVDFGFATQDQQEKLRKILAKQQSIRSAIRIKLASVANERTFDDGVYSVMSVLRGRDDHVIWHRLLQPLGRSLVEEEKQKFFARREQAKQDALQQTTEPVRNNSQEDASKAKGAEHQRSSQQNLRPSRQLGMDSDGLFPE